MKYFINKNCTDFYTNTLVKGGTIVVHYVDEDGQGERGRQVYRICTLEDGRVIKTVPHSVEEYIIGEEEVPDYSDKRYFWKPEKRLLVDFDTEDYSSGGIIKKGTIIDDWMDNEDGTYEVSLDGVQQHRINKNDVTRIF